MIKTPSVVPDFTVEENHQQTVLINKSIFVRLCYFYSLHSRYTQTFMSLVSNRSASVIQNPFY